MGTANPAAAAVQDVIRRAVVPVLKPLGFKKSGTTFRRSVGECIQVLNIQSSSGNTAAEARFTINLGVYFPELEKDSLSSRNGPHEYDCTLRERIGSLMVQPGDHWWAVVPGRWHLFPGRSVDAVVEDVQKSVTELALPWLDKRSDPRAALAATPLGFPAIELALKLGDREAAQRLASAFAAGGLMPSHRAWLEHRGLLPCPT